MEVFPYVPTIDFLNSVIAVFLSYKLYRSYLREQRNPVLLYFSQGYAVLVVSYLFFSIPRLFAQDNSLYIGIGFVVANAFLYLAVAFFAKVTMYFLNVAYVRFVFWGLMVLSAIAVALSVLYFAYPVYDATTSITDWQIHPLVSLSSLIIFVGVLAPSSVFFFWQGARSRDPIVSRRAIIIAFGLLFLIITAYTYYEAKSPQVVLISDGFSLFSYLVIFFGAMYKRGSARRLPLTPLK